jgi:hypothetical protein
MRCRSLGTKVKTWALPRLWRLVAVFLQRRTGIDPESVHVGFVVDNVGTETGFLRVLRFSPASFIPPVLHYMEKRKKLTTFIRGLYNKLQGCGASIPSAAEPFTEKKMLKFYE